MKIAANIAGALLGLAFVAFAILFLFKLGPEQPAPPENSPAGHFMAAFGPTGYMKFVKVIELIGGLLVAIPKTRNLGLLFLGPVIVNILAYHIFLTDRSHLFDPPLVVIVLLATFLLWAGRKAFAGLLA
jgi:putative oxidoreductase